MEKQDVLFGLLQKLDLVSAGRDMPLSPEEAELYGTNEADTIMEHLPEESEVYHGQ
jgi:hypothetical protein